jgi:Tfp pilus assembly protein PilP
MNTELNMTQTMRHTKSNLVMGLALLFLAAGGTLRAQVNPATVKNQAQNGVNQAQQTQQSKSTPPAQTPPKTQAQSQTKAPQQSTTKQATPPAKAPATQGTKPPAANTAKPPATKTPATSGQQPPKTPAANNAATQNQKKAPVKTAAPPKPAPKTGQASQQTPPKTVAKAPAKKPSATPTAEAKPVPPPVRRDPFVTLVGKHQAGGDAAPKHLPPGKAGLEVNTLVIQGILSSPNGMIAVVANPQRSVYFLHAGDELFDGRVDRIDIDGVTFHEVGKDAFGKPLERQVTRKLNPSLGEQP